MMKRSIGAMAAALAEGVGGYFGMLAPRAADAPLLSVLRRSWYRGRMRRSHARNRSRSSYSYFSPTANHTRPWDNPFPQNLADTGFGARQQRRAAERAQAKQFARGMTRRRDWRRHLADAA
jgi:hypothetical protein